MTFYTTGFSTEGSAQSMAYVLNASQGVIADGTYAPSTYASVLTAGGYTSFATAVKTALDGTGGGPYTVSWSVFTGKYTISRGSNFTLAFSTTTTAAAGVRLRLALGFTGDLSGASTYTSTAIPYYVVAPAMAARTDFTDVYEPPDIAEEAVPDGGQEPYGASRDTEELWCDWYQTMETKAATLSRSASSTAPWTWQAFVKHIRAEIPFAVYDSTTSVANLYRMRAEAASFKPERVASDYDGLWNIPFRTRDLGVLT